LDDVIKENQLDAICGLTMGPACIIDNIYGSLGDVFFTTPACKRYPHITVPCGKVYELPIGFHSSVQPTLSLN
jgi:amidase